MGEARKVLDQFNEAMLSGDADRMADLYAADVIVVTPDAGEIKGRDHAVEYIKGFVDALSDLRWEPIATWEAGNAAIDEGYLGGTHTGDLTGPTGEVIPATGESIRIRECDIATVANGVITSHHVYFDQMEFVEQLGMTAATDS